MLSGPGAIGVGGDAGDVHVAGGHFHDEQHVQAAEEDRVDVEEVAGQQPVRLSAEECPPGGVLPAGRWPGGLQCRDVKLPDYVLRRRYCARRSAGQGFAGILPEGSLSTMPGSFPLLTEVVSQRTGDTSRN